MDSVSQNPVRRMPVISRESVFESLDNAQENGYNMREMTLDEIVVDLKTYDADCEHVPNGLLRTFVAEWLKT